MDTLEKAQDFIARNARLLDRHRFAHLFTGAPGEPDRLSSPTARSGAFEDQLVIGHADSNGLAGRTDCRAARIVVFTSP